VAVRDRPAGDPERPFDGIGNLRQPGKVFIAGFCDGSVHTLSPDVGPHAFRAWATPAGSEPVDRP